MRVIENFEIFPESTNTSLYDQRFRSNDHCMLGGAAGNQLSEQIEAAEQIRTLHLLPMDNWKSHEYKGPREFYNLSNKG
jgi:hypothetical protein